MNINDLDGVWDVFCHDLAVSFNLLHDKKVIKDGAGHNIVFGRQWGYFTVTEFDHGFLLNYDHDKNPASMRDIRDVVKKINTGYSGKLYRDGRFIFDFDLTKL